MSVKVDSSNHACHRPSSILLSTFLVCVSPPLCPTTITNYYYYYYYQLLPFSFPAGGNAPHIKRDEGSHIWSSLGSMTHTKEKEITGGNAMAFAIAILML